MRIPGPRALGRGVVVGAGQAVPGAWADVPVHRIDDAVVDQPAQVVTLLHRAWATRTAVAVELAVDSSRFRNPRSWTLPPWQLSAGFEPWLDRLHFLVWANTYDARPDAARPVWWWARKAARLPGVVVSAGDDAGDVRLPGGSAAWIDGGPRRLFAPDDVGMLAVVHRESVEVGRLTILPVPTEPRAGLAADQLAAVGHQAGPARIIAPAGSGKTRVLTERLRHLLVDRGHETEVVLAVAYNKKAQEELEVRTADFRPRVRTLNSVGYALLSQANGGPPRVLDEREVRRLIERLVPIRRHRANADPVGPYLEALGQIRLGLRAPEEVEEWRDDVPGLAEAFDPYRASLKAAGAVDFDEQVYGAVELLLADGGFRARAQAGFRHLLVDEFQDLTAAHVLMLRLLGTPQLDVFGVGDDDQVIYGHAGADPGFLIGFADLFPGAGDHPLEINYRCPAVVVECAAALLSYNVRRVPKVMRPGPLAPTEPDALRVLTHEGAQAAAALVEVVQSWLKDGTPPSQLAVLARVNALLLAPQVALVEAGVPVLSALRPEVLERTGLRAALAYLRIAVAVPGHIAAADVVEILRRPSRGLPQWFPDRLHRRTWWSIQHLRDLVRSVPDKEIARVERLVDDLAAVVAAGAFPAATTRSVLAVIKDGVGLAGAMTLLDGGRGGEGSSHLDDLDALEQVAEMHPDPATFEIWLRTALGAPAAGAAAASSGRSLGEAVTLSTIHRVKGMEWDKVAVFAVNVGIVPHRLAEDEEEERRVLHVAITRCRQQVVLLADRSRPSPMLAELKGAELKGAGLKGARLKGAGLKGVAPRRGGRPSPEGRSGQDRGSGLVGRGGASARTSAGDQGGRGAAGSVPPPTDPVAEQALRAWRTARSRRDGVPPYIVLHDRTLLAIAAARPGSLAILRRVEGIGPTKLEQYGEEILAVLAGVSPEPSSGGPSPPGPGAEQAGLPSRSAEAHQV